MDDYLLRRVAAEIENVIKREDNVSITTLIGGERRKVRVPFDPVRLSASGFDLTRVAAMVKAANQEAAADSYTAKEGQVLVHT